MPKLRHSVIETILTRLETSRFGLAAYKAEFPDRGDTLFRITFTPDPTYTLELSESRNTIWLNMIPGEFKTRDTVNCESIDTAISLIGIWTSNISSELIALGCKRPSIDDIVNTIDSYINEKITEPDTKFDQSEIEQLKTRLANLENKFNELLSATEITKTEHQNIKRDIDSAVKDVTIYSKRVWYKTSMAKVLSTVKAIATSKEGRDLIATAAKKALGLD